MYIGKHLACLLRLDYIVISSVKFFLTKPCLFLVVGILSPNYASVKHCTELSYVLLLLYESLECKDGDLLIFTSPGPSSGPDP